MQTMPRNCSDEEKSNVSLNPKRNVHEACTRPLQQHVMEKEMSPTCMACGPALVTPAPFCDIWRWGPYGGEPWAHGTGDPVDR